MLMRISHLLSSVTHQKVAISATLNQIGRPVTFMSRKFEMHELRYSSVENEATTIIKAVRKWEHLLWC